MKIKNSEVAKNREVLSLFIFSKSSLFTRKSFFAVSLAVFVSLVGIMSVRGGLSALPTHGKIKQVLLISLDILLVPRLGGLYMEDINVALLVAGPGLRPQVIKTPVQTTQIAPTILRAWGLNSQALQAAQREKTRELPE